MFSKDDILRQRAVKSAIDFMSTHTGGSLDAIHGKFKETYKEIYNFLSNKL